VFQPADDVNTTSNVQDYLRMLSKCEAVIESLKGQLGAKDREVERWKGLAEEKDRTIAAQADEIAALRSAAMPRRAERQPLAVEVALDGYGAQRQSRRVLRDKPVRISDEVVRELKNNRKAFPAVCDKAQEYWQLLADAGLVDERLKPTSRCGITVMARIVGRMRSEVDPAISWAFFERYWKVNNLQSNLYRDAYKDSQYYAVVNRIFGLPDDAPLPVKVDREA
jgi:hypothetical protein